MDNVEGPIRSVLNRLALVKNVPDLVKLITAMSDNEKKEYGQQLIDMMLEMDKYMRVSLSENQVLKINTDVFAIQREIWKSVNPEFGLDFNNRFAKRDTVCLTLIYFSMLKVDASAMLKSNDTLLYDVVSSMRSKPIPKYRDCMKVLLYPSFVDALLEFKVKKENVDSQKIIAICNILTQTVVDKDICFETEWDLDIFMQFFLSQVVYPRIGATSNRSKDEKDIAYKSIVDLVIKANRYIITNYANNMVDEDYSKIR